MNETYDKAIELAIGTVGLDADAGEIFSLATEYAEYLEEFPMMMTMLEYAIVKEGTLVDADLEKGKITIAVRNEDDLSKNFDGSYVEEKEGNSLSDDVAVEEDHEDLYIADTDFMSKVLPMRLERLSIGDDVRVCLGADAGKIPSLSCRVPSNLCNTMSGKIIWVQPL